MNNQLSEEQRKKIDENRKQALARRTGKVNNAFLSEKGWSKQGSLPSPNNPMHTEPSTSRKTQSLYSSITQRKLFEPPVNKRLQQSSTSSKISSIHQPQVQGSSSGLSKAGSRGGAAMKKEQFYGAQESVLKGNCVLISQDRFAVEIGYNSALIEFFKQLDTRQYETSTRTWSFNLAEYKILMKGVAVFQPSIQVEGLPRIILQTFKGPKKDDGIPEVDLSKVDEKLIDSLFPFQKEGVFFGVQHEGRILLADDMGLGKTLQALCIACYYRDEWPLLIVAPSSVRHDWARQICQWLPSIDRQDINVIDSGKTDITRCSVTIISYDLLSKKIVSLQGHKFKVIIMDESHFLKNFKAVRTKAAMQIVKFAKRVILLSGTPALSRPAELYPQISCVCLSMFKFNDFGLRYCNGKQQPWGWDYSGSSNMTELQLLLEKKIMIRRQKKDVLSQLPTKTRQVVFLNPNLMTLHNDLKKTYKIMNGSRLKGVERHGLLLQYFHQTCKVKLSAVRDYILDLVEAEKKFLVFAHHQDMLDNIEDAVKEKVSYIRIDGRTTSEQRSFFCRKFQKSADHKVAILSITAANAGLNLSAASLVIFAELFWNPGILVQAEDRVHRIGQENAVSIQYLIAQKTADDFIWPLVQDKLNVLSKAGLTRDNFSDAGTMQVADKSQKKILDMFTEEFIETSEAIDVQNSEPETCPKEKGSNASVDPVSPTSHSPSTSKRKNTGKRSATSSPAGTPSKKQMSITNFFPTTPPSKVAISPTTPSSKVTKLDSTHCSKLDSSKKLFDDNFNQECGGQAMTCNTGANLTSHSMQLTSGNNGTVSTFDGNGFNGDNKGTVASLSQEDMKILSEVDWDEEFF